MGWRVQRGCGDNKKRPLKENNWKTVLFLEIVGLASFPNHPGTYKEDGSSDNVHNARIRHEGAQWRRL